MAKISLAKLGEEATGPAPRAKSESSAEYFIVREGHKFAGCHLLVDLWGANMLGDLRAIETALVDACKAARATLLHTHFHHFGEGMGVSGVVVLAESHVSIHTWPEEKYAAIDVFMCGTCDPHKAVQVIRERFRPTSLQVSEHKRGVMYEDLPRARPRPVR